ncbi:adenosylcobinamide-phosphate synthase CbiB [Bacteroides sp. OttesenSCG-928-D19]|nr:adenosylcobinamide-phosphate synthase CbiB [Bacteroides sp. OttesenSCG-928-D19]
MENFLFILIPLCLGWLLDKIFGDPRRLPHPVVFFGHLIAAGEQNLNHGKNRFWKGGAMSITLIAGVFFMMVMILSIFRSQFIFTGAVRMLAVSQMISAHFTSIVPLACFFSNPATEAPAELSALEAYHNTLLYRGIDTFNFWFAVIIASIFVFYCLAGKTLVREVREVFRACDRSLEEGRKRVARIVGRDTSNLSDQEVRTAALETLAENLSDGVIAPLFWYMLLGVPGMVAYKMINTLDSMIGYRNKRFNQFGQVAARIDDFANFIPARLTAILMVLVSGKWSSFAFVFRYGNKHLSPNSGYPEAALAGMLNCRFGGPHDYSGQIVDKPYIGTNDRSLTTNDMIHSIKNAQYTEILAMIICITLIILFYFL